MRAPGSSLVSTTKPGTSRVWSAPMSRTADQTSSAGACVVSSDRIVAMGLFPPEIGFEPITLRVEHVGGVIMRPVILAQSGLAVVTSAVRERGGMERRDARPVRGGKAEMQARLRVVGDRTLGGTNPESDAFLAVAQRALVGAETGKSKRLQRRVVKALGLRDVANADRNVIQHMCPRWVDRRRGR